MGGAIGTDRQTGKMEGSQAGRRPVTFLLRELTFPIMTGSHWKGSSRGYLMGRVPRRMSAVTP